MGVGSWITCVVAAALSMTAGSTQATDKPKPTGSDRIVCREMMRTGTRFTKQTCRTVAEWEKMTEQNRKTASEMIDRPFLPDCRRNPPC